MSGVGLSATGAGQIVVSGVPEGEDVVAAFLYWQAVAREDSPDVGGQGARFRGNLLSSPQGIASKRLGPGSPMCAIPGGDPKGPRRAFTYRMDVLRYFAVDENPGPNFGKLAPQWHPRRAVAHRQQRGTAWRQPGRRLPPHRRPAPSCGALRRFLHDGSVRKRHAAGHPGYLRREAGPGQVLP